jgi:uncharacterized protein DUF3107
MEVKIGVLHTPKELTVEIEEPVDDVVARFEAAISGGGPMVWLTDARGKRVGVPADRVAYVEIEADGTDKRVGFGR